VPASGCVGNNDSGGWPSAASAVGSPKLSAPFPRKPPYKIGSRRRKLPCRVDRLIVIDRAGSARGLVAPRFPVPGEMDVAAAAEEEPIVRRLA
jgi:hypothetical protein